MEFAIEGGAGSLETILAPALTISVDSKIKENVDFVLSARVAGGRSSGEFIHCPVNGDPSQPNMDHYYSAAYPTNCGDNDAPIYNHLNQTLIAPSLESGLRLRLPRFPLTLDVGLVGTYQIGKITHQFFDPYEPQDVTTVKADYSTWIFSGRLGVNYVVSNPSKHSAGIYLGMDLEQGYRFGESFFSTGHHAGGVSAHIGFVLPK